MITYLLANNTREPPKATIMWRKSWRNWPATQATLRVSTTNCRRRRVPSTSPNRVISNVWTFVLMTLTILSLIFQSAATTSIIVQLITDTSTARCKPMTISRYVLGSKSGNTVLIILLLVQRLHLSLCQLLAKFILDFIVACGSWLTNRRAITMRSINTEEEIDSYTFPCSRARSIGLNKQSIAKATA